MNDDRFNAILQYVSDFDGFTNVVKESRSFWRTVFTQAEGQPPFELSEFTEVLTETVKEELRSMKLEQKATESHDRG